MSGVGLSCDRASGLVDCEAVRDSMRNFGEDELHDCFGELVWMRVPSAAGASSFINEIVIRRIQFIRLLGKHPKPLFSLTNYEIEFGPSFPQFFAQCLSPLCVLSHFECGTDIIDIQIRKLRTSPNEMLEVNMENVIC